MDECILCTVPKIRFCFTTDLLMKKKKRVLFLHVPNFANLPQPQVSTTIGPSAGVLVMVVSLKVLEKKFDTRGVNNGILSGLVAVTAGAPLLNPEGAFVIGVISAGVYYTSANLLLKLRIDDVVDAVRAVTCLCV